MKSTFIVVSLLSLFLIQAEAQIVESDISRGNYFHAYEIDMQETGPFLYFSDSFMAFTILIDAAASFDGMSVQLPGHNPIQIIENTEDTDHQYAGIKKISGLVVLDEYSYRIKIINPHQIPLTLHTYNPGTPEVEVPARSDVWRSGCEKPTMIDQSVWRSGLADPKPNPAYTQPEHIVVHHTATSNQNTDHLSTVRAIYIAHTETNGWDDIGYNFVIARDGTIYAGRDGQGLEDDYVKGAHFCGKNSYTMGVSILGTYTEEMPPQAAIKSLEKLMAWKLYKDEINPKAYFTHPKKSGGYALGTVCGHRDGCATECPGDSLYSLLEQVKDTVLNQMLLCGFSSVTGVGNEAVRIFPQPANNEVNIVFPSSWQVSDIQVLDLNGKVLIHKNIMSNRQGINIETGDIPGGLYIVRLNGDRVLRSFLITTNPMKK